MMTVDNDVRTFFEILKQISFLENAVNQSIALLQRMRPA